MSKTRVLLLVFLLTTTLVGCTPTKKSFIVWPLPPDQPRVQFLGNYYSQDDFDKSGKQVFAENFLGKPELTTFKTPFGIAVDSRERVYVSDIHDRNLRVYDMKAKTVNYYLKEPPFSAPRGLDVDAADRLYVTDLTAQAVLVFSPDRQPLRRIGAGILKMPFGVTVSPDGSRVYVADTSKDAIKNDKGKTVELARGQIYVFDGNDGKLLYTCGGEDGVSALAAPQGVAVGPDGNLYVADTLKARIVVFDPQGAYLRHFGVRGDHPYEFEGPKDLAFDSEGHLWITDGRGGRVGIFDPVTGRLYLSLGDARRTAQALGFGVPAGIFIDPSNRVYIADASNHRFGIWQYFSEAYLAEHPITPEQIKELEVLKANQQAKEGALPAK